MTYDTTVIKDPVGLHTLEVISKADRFNYWMFDQFRDHLKGEVLEIGSGIGNVSKLVIRDGHMITLSDYNRDYCQILKANFSTNKSVREVLQIDLLDAAFKDRFSSYKEKFDSIFLLNVIEHIPDDNLAIRNCSYLLKKGGHLVVLAPAYSWLYCNFDKELGHYKRYTLGSMTSLLNNHNFKIVKGSYFNFTGIAGWLVFGKLLRRKMLGNGEMSVFNKLVPLSKYFDKLIRNKIGLSIIVTGKKDT